MLALLTAISSICVAEDVGSIGEENPQAFPKSIGSTSTPGEDAAVEATLLESVNRSRQQIGLGPLRMEESLRLAARLHAQRMAAAQRLEHQLPGEPALLQRIAAVSSLPLDRAGENIANVTCAADVHQLLMNSPAHRENILDPHFNVAGIAAIWSHGRLYVVQDFAHATPSYSAKATAQMVGEAIGEARQSAGLNALAQLKPPNLDEAVCSMAKQGHPSARLIAASYHDQKIAAYTQSNPQLLPPGAQRLLNNPSLHQFAVGSCYARNTTYPTGIYWVAILLH